MSKAWPSLVLLVAGVAFAAVGVSRVRATEATLFLFDENAATGELEVVGAPLIWPWYAGAAACLVAAGAIYRVPLR